ncbi:kinetochore-associated protein DSN1 homolog isoform X1 [Coregonus clupeaformis]|uniref:kinetochore-associated protein DSN1 homolog isoform X1 n=1 Tax=Coregonus clupeaformis TaxID=59861 RepID=UPI001E1C6360|nr:kinetochore-associated protein DSN1 homolog isoform X1 [Coregonus clupeaformis]
MADMNSGKQSESSCDSSAEHKKKVHQEENPQQGLKRLCPGSPSPAAPHPKSPRRHTPASTTTNTQMSETTEVQMEPALEPCSGEEGQGRDPEGCVLTEGRSLSPSSTQRKSWRRSTRGRRSLPALPNTSQTLCRSISQSLPEEERLEKLMEASMRLAVEKLQDSLSTTPNASLESLQTQVEAVQKGWCCLAKDLRSEPPCQQPPTSTASDTAMQNTMEQTRKAIHRLQAESASWESLLDKHRSKAEELARRVEQGQEKGVTLDPSCLAQSSQSQLIQNKPDYHSLLCRQQPILSTMDMVMDTQCKMVRELLSIQEQSQLLVKETSRRLAADGGFQDLPSDPVRDLLAGPLSSVSTNASSTVSS